MYNLRSFIPYIEGKGIRDLYEITRIRTITSREAKQSEGDSNFVDDLRLAFELRFSRQLFDEYKMVHLNIDHAFTQTEFDELDKLVVISNLFELNLNFIDWNYTVIVSVP